MSRSPSEPFETTTAARPPWEILPLAVARFNAQGSFAEANSRFFRWLDFLSEDPPD